MGFSDRDHPLPQKTARQIAHYARWYLTVHTRYTYSYILQQFVVGLGLVSEETRSKRGDAGSKQLRNLYFDRLTLLAVPSAVLGCKIPLPSPLRLSGLGETPLSVSVRCWYVARAHPTQHEDPNRPPTKPRHSLQPTQAPSLPSACSHSSRSLRACAKSARPMTRRTG